MRWIIDTSAWSHRGRPEVVAQLRALLADDDELVLSPAVELEILREPRGTAVGALRRELEASMDVLEATPETFALAADAMERLAAHETNAHRRPVADLLTAALAHQHGCGIVHDDGDYELIAAHGGLTLPLARVNPDRGADPEDRHPARRQRALRNELAGLVHQMPVAEAEHFLATVVADARRRVYGSAGNA